MLLALVRKELLALTRDLHGLGALFVLPTVFIIVMSMALKDVYSPHVDHLAWAVNDQEQEALTDKFLHLWQQENGAPVALPADWQQALREGRLSYVIDIASGAATDMIQLSQPDTQRIGLFAEPGIDFGIFAALQARMQATATAVRVETLIGNLPPEYVQSLRLPGPSANQPLDINALSADALVKAERMNAGPRPTSVQHNVPAWLIFGMFFVISTIAGLFVEERSCGALSRLRSLGASPFTLLGAKVLPYMLINLLQAALMLLVGIYVMPLLGGDALSLQGIELGALLVMLLSISLAAICLALLVATLVRSQAQAAALGPMLNILMAAVGGIMVPVYVMPASMQNLAQFSPMNWALNGLLDVLLRGAGLINIYAEVLQLLSLAAVALVSAYFIFRFKKL